MAAYWFSAAHRAWTIENALALNLLAFLFFFTGICLLFLGTVFLRAIMFPMAILAFVIPFPNFLRHALETFLQYGSAFFAQIFLQRSPTPVLLEGLDFHLPGCVIEVAPECSGIHSTIVLLIVSLLGGWLFLALAVEPRPPRVGRYSFGADSKRLSDFRDRPALRRVWPPNAGLPHPPPRRAALFCLVTDPLFPAVALFKEN